MAAGERVAKFEQPAADASLDRAEGFVELGRDFLLGQTGEERELESAQLLGRERRKRTADGEVLLFEQQIVDGVRFATCLTSRQIAGRRFLQEGDATGAGADAVDGTISGQRDGV